MKRLLLLSIYIVLSNIIFAQVNLVPAGINRPADFEYLSAPDSTGKRMPLKMPTLTKASSMPTLPYPIIFIHGLVGKSDTWDTFTSFLNSQYGLIYGGRMDFCLNYDGDNTKANTVFAPTAGADLAMFTPTLIAGDYYYLNFDVGMDGSYNPNGSIYDSWSNQQAIVKQGLAVKWAIYYVLKITGRDKVILMGHSMGGLSAREYLQNSSIWQPDGKHHVAKLVTTGTPHGGSNSTAFGLGIPKSMSINEKMDATRDLRRSYAISGANGVYLFGGIESNSIMNNNILFNYYNVDVNCNGTYGENITGLNQKSIFTNLDYSCIIGECSGCIIDPNPGDGVVWDICADLKNYYPNLSVNRFYYYATATVQIHTDLPKQSYENMQGLDEPKEYSLAYHVGFDTSYTGFITVQPGGGYSPDYDEYKFSVPVKSKVTVNMNNIHIADLMVNIRDLSNNIVGTIIHSNGLSNINFIQLVNAGSYYLEIYGTPSSSSYLYPYNFILNSSTTGTDLLSESKFEVYPNPATDLITIKSNNNISLSSTYIINDQLGRRIMMGKLNNEATTIDISQLESGLYFLQVGQQSERTFKVIKK